MLATDSGLFLLFPAQIWNIIGMLGRKMFYDVVFLEHGDTFMVYHTVFEPKPVTKYFNIHSWFKCNIQSQLFFLLKLSSILMFPW